MTYLGQALVIVVAIVTAAAAIGWLIKFTFGIIAKMKKEQLSMFEEPLTQMMNACAAGATSMFKLVTKELDKTEENND